MHRQMCDVPRISSELKSIPLRGKKVTSKPMLKGPIELPSLAMKLTEFGQELSSEHRSSTVVGWFFLSVGLGDALLVSFGSGSLFGYCFRQLSMILESQVPNEVVHKVSAVMVPCLVILSQIIVLRWAALNLRGSPWSVWMARSFQGTSVLTSIQTIFGRNGFKLIKQLLAVPTGRYLSIRSHIVTTLKTAMPIVRSILLLFLQGVALLAINATLQRLVSSLPALDALSPSFLGIVAFCCAFFSAWMLTALCWSIFRERSALPGLILGFVVVIVGFVLANGRQGVFVVEEARWFAMLVLVGSLVMISGFALDVWNAGQSVPIALGNKPWLHCSIMDFRNSILPTMKFTIDKSQTILALRRDSSGDFRIHPIDQPIVPTESAYEFLNLTSFANQPQLQVNLETLDGLYKVGVQFKARSSAPNTNYSDSEQSSFVFAGPAVNKMIQEYFRSEGQASALNAVMNEVLKTCVPSKEVKFLKYLNECEEIIRTSRLGLNSGAGSERGNVVEFDSRNTLALAESVASNRRSAIPEIQLRIRELISEINDYENNLAGSTKELNFKFHEQMMSSLISTYDATMQKRYGQTLEFFVRFVNFDIISVSITPTEKMNQLRARIDETNRFVTEAVTIDAPLFETLKSRDASVTTIVRDAINQGADLEQIAALCQSTLIGVSQPTAAKTAAKKQEVLPEHKPEF